MAYLSRIYLNPLRPGAQRLLRDPQAMHAAILGALPRQPVTERILWRLEGARDYRARLLVLTQSMPAWDHLVEQAGWPGTEEGRAAVRPYDRFLERVVTGAEFIFRLRANPVMATKQPLRPSPAQAKRLREAEGRVRGVTVPHKTVASQMQWLLDRVEKWGFTVPRGDDGTTPAVAIVERERLVFLRRSGSGQSHRVVLHTATFEGRLCVVDEAAARRSLLQGVGRGRAYGCGLITIAPVASATAEGGS